jgi:chemotaxis signal transduction protein
MSVQLSSAELRRAFDASFAVPPAAEGEHLADFLIVRAAANRLALRLAEVSLVEAVRKIVPLPAGRRGLLGLAGVRGRPLPVFSLASLLGEAEDSAARWLCVHEGHEPIAFGVDAIEQFVRVGPSDLAALVGSGEHASYTTGMLRVNAQSYTVVSLTALAAHIEEGAAGAARKER